MQTKFKIKPKRIDEVLKATAGTYSMPVAEAQQRLVDAQFVLTNLHHDLRSGLFQEVKDHAGFELNLKLEWLTTEEVTTKIQVNDWLNNHRVIKPHEYEPHDTVQIRNMPETIDRIGVTVDNGQLSVDLNGEYIFHTQSLTMGRVVIER